MVEGNKRGRKKILLPVWIKEVMDNGFSEVGPYSVNGEKHYIQKNTLQDVIKKFDTRGLGRFHKANDFFGAKNSVNGWWYLSSNPILLIKYLEQVFEEVNPLQGDERDKRKAFTMLMHANNFHWKGCCQHKKEYEGQRL